MGTEPESEVDEEHLKKSRKNRHKKNNKADDLPKSSQSSSSDDDEPSPVNNEKNGQKTLKTSEIVSLLDSNKKKHEPQNRLNNVEETQNVDHLSDREINDMKAMIQILIEGQKELLRKCNFIIQSISDMKIKISELEKKVSSNTTCQVMAGPSGQGQTDFSEELSDLLSLSTMEAFDEFEWKLENPIFRKKVKNFMKNIGGPDAHKLIHNILEKFMSDRLATKFNIDGKLLKKKDNEGNDLERKGAFKDTRLFCCIMDSVTLKYTDVDKHRLKSKSIG